MQRCHICNPCTIPGAYNSLRHLLVSQALYLTLFLKHLKVQRIIQSLSKLIRSFFLPGLRFGKFTKLEATCMRFLLLLGFARAEAYRDQLLLRCYGSRCAKANRILRCAKMLK